MYFKNLTNFHIFYKKGKYFLYGINNLAIFEISKLSYDILKTNMPLKKSQIIKNLINKYSVEEINNTLKNLKSWGILGHHNFEILSESGFPNPYKKELNDKYYIHGLYITISQICNLKCKYCSADFGKFGNSDAINYMNKETAKKSVDFLINNIRPNVKNPLIAFVGGEPLLNFEILKFIVDYTKKVSNLEPRYILNTNGTQVTEDIAHWFAKNNIPLRFSIDGNEMMHNKNRVYRNGKGSYCNVMKGLNIYKKYHKNGFYVQSAFEHANNLVDGVHHLWNLGANMVLANPALDSPFFQNGKFEMTKEDWRKYEKQIQKLNNEITIRMINNKKTPLINHTFTNLEHLFTRKNRKAGCGVGRTIAITPEGKLYPCQAFVGNDDYLMGNLEKGIDKDFMENFGNIYVNYLNKCNNCWAKNSCNTGCIALSIQYNEMGNEFEPSKFCQFERNFLEYSIYNYTKIKEKRPEFLNKIFQK
jgi:uncharacterized protein